MNLKERVDKVFENHGEDFLINGTTPAKGFFQLLSNPRIATYFDGIEQDYFTRPGLALTVSADTTIAVDNTIARDGRTYTVKKISKHRVKNTVVVQMVILT